jgi:hypothetical protein
VKGLDLEKLVSGLENIQEGFAGAVEIASDAYAKCATLVESGKNFRESLKEGLDFDQRRDWYTVLQGADVLIRDGELATFRELVYQAPCRRNPAFQWGVCQRLGEIAANSMWEPDVRQDAIDFLGKIYLEDATWGQQVNVKQWILNILMKLALSTESTLQCK